MTKTRRLTEGQRRFLWSLTDEWLEAVLIDAPRSGPSVVHLGLAEHGISEDGHAQYRWPQP